MPRKRIDWTEEMLEYLLDHYETDSCMDMGMYLGVSAPTVSSKLRSMGISVGIGGKKLRRRWSDDELSYLREHYPHESAVDIADVLGVCSQLVRTKANELGLKKAPDYDRSKYYFRYVKTYRHGRRGAA